MEVFEELNFPFNSVKKESVFSTEVIGTQERQSNVKIESAVL